MKPKLKTIILSGIAGCGLALSPGTDAVTGMSPAELAERLESASPPLVVDIRDNPEYRRGHLPGAINIPGSVLFSRPLPRNREIVLYGDGLGRVLAADYADNLRDGRTARTLRGGLAGWESAGLSITGASGLRTDSVPGITYQQLTAAQGSGVTLVDLRREPSGPQAAPLEESGDEPELTDLAAAFPEARVVRSGETVPPHAALAAGDQESAGEPSGDDLLVLIDRGDGRAEEKARQLRAAGNRRVVVLVGGETILRHEGRPGLERLSSPMRPIDGWDHEQEGDHP